MTSKLLIAYPDIPAAALSITAGHTYAEDTHMRNTCWGMRHTLGQLATATADPHYVHWDLGAAASAPKTAQYFIIARADILKTQGVTTVTLKGSPSARVDGSSGTTVFTNADFQNATLTGPKSNDYLITGAASSAYRYWWIDFANGSTSKYGRSKTYFGSFLDLGVDPSRYSYMLLEDNSGELAFPSGNIRMVKINEPRYRFEIEWRGVTDALAQNFADLVLANPTRHYVFLYATNTQILGGQTLVHCKAVAEECVISKTNKKDYAVVHGVFEQVVG